jgi:hypothetical protein
VGDLPFPEKTMFGNMNQDTVSERVELLGQFCKYACKMVSRERNRRVHRSGEDCLAPFLFDDGSDNSIVDLLAVTKYTESTEMRLDRVLAGAGCRSVREKNMFLLHGPSGAQCLTVLSHGDGALDNPSLLDTKSKRGHFRSFVKDCRHPFVLAPSELVYLRRKQKMLVFRDYAARGSLRDMIHRANPTHPYAEKYAEHGRPMPEKKLGLLGRQVPT